MKKIITSFENITKDTFSLSVNKEDIFIILHTSADNMSFDLYNQLSKFPATVQFLKCEKQKQKEIMYFLLGNLCATKTSKQYQIYLIQKGKEEFNLDILKEFLTIGHSYEIKESIEEIYEPKRNKTKRNTTGKAKTTSKEGQPITVERLESKKKVETQAKIPLGNTKDFKTAIKKIDATFDFEPYIENIEEAFKNSLETISFEVQLQIRTSNEEGTKIHKILAPYYDELKKKFF